MSYHHHGRDGSCHSGPGGMFGCGQCDLDRYRDGEEAEEKAEAQGWAGLGDAGDQP